MLDHDEVYDRIGIVEPPNINFIAFVMNVNNNGLHAPSLVDECDKVVVRRCRNFYRFENALDVSKLLLKVLQSYHIRRNARSGKQCVNFVVNAFIRANGHVVCLT